MKFQKIFLWLFLVVFISSFSFGIGVYEDVNFYYYVKNNNPDVTINISAGDTPLLVNKGLLSIDGVDSQFDVPETNKYLSRFSQKQLQFNLDKDISSAKIVKFKLYVYSQLSNKIVKPQGDPVEFFIKYDNVTPNLISIENNYVKDGTIILKFDKTVHFVDLTIDGKKVNRIYNVKNSHIISSKEIIVDVKGIDFSSEYVNVIASFEDLAGNKGTYEGNIVLPADDLRVDLLTMRNDSSLVYNYDRNYKNFFNGTIYSKITSFELKIKTNKPANCYFSANLWNFIDFSLVNDKQEFTSSASGLIHSFSIDTSLHPKIWVACTNKYMENEVAYLEDDFGKNLIKVEFYDSYNGLKIMETDPVSLVTNNPFSVFAKTNQRAICFYNIDSKDEKLLDTSDYKNFEELDLYYTGKHDLNFRCFNVLNYEVKQTNKLNIDTSKGVSVAGYEPKYTSESSAQVTLHLSESGDIDCRYSLTQIPPSNQAIFLSLANTSGTGPTRTFKISSLKSGNNSMHIYCSKENQVSRSTINVIYDDKGIQLENITFVNGKYESDTYCGDTNKITVKFDVLSLIPISSYLLQIDAKNTTNYREFKSKIVSVDGDFSDANKLTIVATNELGVNRSFNKIIKFDYTGPQVTYSKTGEMIDIICMDAESGCSDVYYGFSQTIIDCKANALYSNNNSYSSLDGSGKNYLCVDAYNFAGISTHDVKSLSEDSDSSDLNPGNGNGENDDDNNQSSTEEGNSSDDDETYGTEDPINPTEDPQNDGESSSSSFYLIAGIVLLLAGSSGGGYYAYKKGYLDNELERLGIHLHKNKDKLDGHTLSSGSSWKQNTTNDLSDNTKFTSSPLTALNEKDLKQSSYDAHLKKINKFIDEKIGRSSEVFGKFDNNKGKVDGYKDTMIKKVKKTNLKDEDFDEFYKKSSKGVAGSVDNSLSLAKEAEKFEEFYNKKKESKKDGKNN